MLGNPTRRPESPQEVPIARTRQVRGTTLAMVKPDGLSRPEVVSAVFDGLCAEGLSVVRQDELTLTDADVAHLFPLFRDSPLTLFLLSAYLTSGPVLVLVLEGETPITKAVAVRAAIRSRYAKSSFANCLHVAADTDEAALQMRWLADRTGWPLPPQAPTPSGNPLRVIPGLTGRMARLGADRLRELAASVWRVADTAGWEGHWALAPGGGPWTVVVISETRNSIDSAASHLLEEVPGLTPEEAVFAALEIDRADSAPVYCADLDRARAVQEALVGRELQAQLVPASTGWPAADGGIHG